jgi:TonB family protein
MHPILVYILQVNFALVLFYLLFTLLFKRDTFLKIRRFYFLSALLFSVIYPLLVVPGLSDFWNFRFSEPQMVEATVFFEAPTLEVMVEESEAEAASLNIPWEQIFITLYIAVTIFFILRFLWQLISIFRIRLKSEETEVLGIKVYDLKDNITPFSFFGMIFINSEMHSKEELEQIIIHEHTHVSEKHSLDIMLVESILLFSWWNPAVWLLKREMAMNLEYLADVGVLREGVDSREYQYHLLRLTYHETAVQIVNNFNVSQLKQRIMMMNKTRSSSLKLAKYLTILPIFFILIAANSSYAGEKDQSLQEPPPVKKEVTEEIFVVVEEQPEYPGGQEAMMKFLSDSIVYPDEAKAKGIQGRVICNFVVMKDGSIDDVNVVRGVDPLLDAEAVRVLKSMPAWKPGKQRGQAVNVRYTLPVVFRLDNKPLSEEKKEELQRIKDSFVEAEFPGGESAYFKYLTESIKYPVIAQENGIQGLVLARYRILSNGKVEFIDITNGADPLLGREVQRIIEGMPDWTPSRIDGKGTTSVATLTVQFRLQGDNTKPYDGPSLPENAIVVVGYAS